MDLDALLREENLSPAQVDAISAWARGRAAAIVRELEIDDQDADLKALLVGGEALQTAASEVFEAPPALGLDAREDSSRAHDDASEDVREDASRDASGEASGWAQEDTPMGTDSEASEAQTDDLAGATTDDEDVLEFDDEVELIDDDELEVVEDDASVPPPPPPPSRQKVTQYGPPDGGGVVPAWKAALLSAEYGDEEAAELIREESIASTLPVTPEGGDEQVDGRDAS